MQPSHAATLSLQPGMTVARIGAGENELNSLLSHAVGPTGQVHEIEIPAHAHSECCDRVVVVNPSAGSQDPISLFRQASRLLVKHGRLIVVESNSKNGGFDELVRLLEHNAFTIHGHGIMEGGRYFLEVAVTGESVQS